MIFVSVHRKSFFLVDEFFRRLTWLLLKWHNQNPVVPFKHNCVYLCSGNTQPERNCMKKFLWNCFVKPFSRFSRPSSVLGRKVTASRSEGEKSAVPPEARIDGSDLKGGQVLMFLMSVRLSWVLFGGEKKVRLIFMRNNDFHKCLKCSRFSGESQIGGE